TKPLSLKPRRKVLTRCSRPPEAPLLSQPTIGTFGCCARASNGQESEDAAAPPRSAMSCRRLRSNIRQPLPWFRRWSVYRSISLLRRAQQVLGAGLNCSEIGGLMSALGQKQTSGGDLGHVRFTPKSGHWRAGAGRSALCQ